MQGIKKNRPVKEVRIQAFLCYKGQFPRRVDIWLFESRRGRMLSTNVTHMPTHVFGCLSVTVYSDTFEVDAWGVWRHNPNLE
uniref:Uncharacterized protein n=1 Tax=Candidatus Kentrum sp. FW TaxID=2126338 RepID=A0A450TN53_9GAMM|nr:MAG: hypothetical protein BECKFW1821C_GA0114237_10189 [Candidatus Kentron sp. FW]